ncbi:MAG TPA: AarF/UbiB family protein [Tepidisphaeraceae bacterium]|nr:AarF/UbiB family protein [Tepidisphaeraceae bacterium]
MITESDIASLVPDCYAEFRQIVAEGVMFYLQNLSPARLARVMAAQMTLPSDADVAARTVLLLHESPALHKLGQVIARHRELDATLRHRLQQLESMEPRTPMEDIRPLILREMGPALEPYRLEIGDSALAEASVAVVVPFSWSSSNEPTRHPGVLKVLKPHIEQYLDEDLTILSKLSEYIDQRRVAYHLPPVEYRETFDEASAILTHEIHLSDEQANLAAASRHFAHWRDVQVPGCLPFSTPHVTAMQRVYGTKVTDLIQADRSCRRRIAATMVRALVADPILSTESQTIFHADPHAGNLMGTPDGRLGILDWSLTGTLTLSDRDAVSQVLVGGAQSGCASHRQGHRTTRHLRRHRRSHSPRDRAISGRNPLEWLAQLALVSSPARRCRSCRCSLPAGLAALPQSLFHSRRRYRRPFDRVHHRIALNADCS